jgi:hypothetical protein
MVTGDWGPIHRFSAENHLPCLFPITELPVIDAPDWNTLYLSRGLYQQGMSAAEYLARQEVDVQQTKVVMVYRDTPEGLALAQSFAQRWTQLGGVAPREQKLAGTKPLTSGEVASLCKDAQPQVLVAWLGEEVLPELELLAQEPARPAHVMVSANLLGDALWRIPAAAAPFTRILYPDPVPNVASQNAPRAPSSPEPPPWPPSFVARHRETQLYAITRLLADTLMEIKKNCYRDYFLELIDMMGQNSVRPGMSMGAVGNPDLSLLTFGPGQRYAAKGCYVVGLKPGPQPTLDVLGDWKIH